MGSTLSFATHQGTVTETFCLMFEKVYIQFELAATVNFRVDLLTGYDVPLLDLVVAGGGLPSCMRWTTVTASFLVDNRSENTLKSPTHLPSRSFWLPRAMY